MILLQVRAELQRVKPGITAAQPGLPPFPLPVPLLDQWGSFLSCSSTERISGGPCAPTPLSLSLSTPPAPCKVAWTEHALRSRKSCLAFPTNHRYHHRPLPPTRSVSPSVCLHPLIIYPGLHNWPGGVDEAVVLWRARACWSANILLPFSRAQDYLSP